MQFIACFGLVVVEAMVAVAFFYGGGVRGNIVRSIECGTPWHLEREREAWWVNINIYMNGSAVLASRSLRKGEART